MVSEGPDHGPGFAKRVAGTVSLPISSFFPFFPFFFFFVFSVFFRFFSVFFFCPFRFFCFLLVFPVFFRFFAFFCFLPVFPFHFHAKTGSNRLRDPFCETPNGVGVDPSLLEP